ncbi:hypothetical protein AAF712_010666 [Marasmius tenuissimus]|uniref:Uncharacterized protein n=1 Tax=Marasmius tenuissimus TaxID=585030 RepID=A0ABR2ZNE7_9AGAR
MATDPRPYETGDLEGLPKSELVPLVLAQIECWPPNQNGKKVTTTQIKRDTTVADLRRELLKNDNGFKTTRPRRSTTVAMEPPPPATGTQAISGTGSETIPIQEPTGGGAGSFTKGQPVLLYVFVRDLRPQYQNTKGQAAMIIVNCATNPINNKPFLASGADVLREVQTTNAAIQGTEAVTISQQFLEHEQYQVTFAKAFNPEAPDYAALASTLLRLPSDSNLFLEVNVDSPKGDTDLQSAKPETKGGRTAQKGVVEWLQEQLKGRPDYENFKGNVHCSRTNPEIVEHWRFVYEFVKEYECKRPVLSEKRCRITQAELATALGYCRTTLKIAIAGYQVVKDHGRSGYTPIESIVTEVERTDDPQKGATVLYNFLQASL